MQTFGEICSQIITKNQNQPFCKSVMGKYFRFSLVFPMKRAWQFRKTPTISNLFLEITHHVNDKNNTSFGKYDVHRHKKNKNIRHCKTNIFFASSEI